MITLLILLVFVPTARFDDDNILYTTTVLEQMLGLQPNVTIPYPSVPACYPIAYSAIPDPKPPNPENDTSWYYSDVALDDGVVLVRIYRSDDPGNFCKNYSLWPAMIPIHHLTTNSYDRFCNSSYPAREIRYYDPRKYYPWPFPNMPARCTIVTATWWFQDNAPCSLSSDCGWPIIKQFKSSFFSVTQTACIGSGFPKYNIPQHRPDNLREWEFVYFQNETCRSQAYYYLNDAFLYVNSTHFIPKSLTQYTTTALEDGETVQLQLYAGDLEQIPGGGVCVKRLVNPPLLNFSYQARAGASPYSYIPWPKLPQVPVGNGWCAGFNISFGQAYCQKWDSPTLCRAWYTYQNYAPYALFRCNEPVFTTCAPSDYRGTSWHPFTNIFYATAIELKTWLNDIDGWAQGLLAWLARFALVIVQGIVKFIIGVLVAELRILLVTIWFLYRAWQYDNIIRPLIEAGALFTLSLLVFPA